MQKNISAGIVIFRKSLNLEFLLCHMGGPYWQDKDNGAWGIPKGLVEENESLLDGAIRECKEEIGFDASDMSLSELAPVKMKTGKTIYAWACEVSGDVQFNFSSNYFEMEWPPKSGMIESFPEIDECKWFRYEEALEKIIGVQKDLLIQVSKIV